MACAESKFEIEKPLSKFHCHNRCASKAGIDFGGRVYACRQIKLVPVVFADKSNATRFH